jgi:hypothetical protein
VDGLAKALAAHMKKKELGKKDPEDIAKRLAGLAEEDLAALLERLRGIDAKDRGNAAPVVEKMAEDALLSARWGPAILRLPDAVRRLADPSEGARCTLIADLSRLEDAEPATRFTLWALEGASGPVRLRAVDALADLCSYGGDAARLLPPLRKALEDPSAAVRDLALERLAGLGDAAALDWSIEHAGEPAEESAVHREVKERRCPGERALEIATRATRVRYGMDADDWQALPEDERALAREQMRGVRSRAGDGLLRNGEEGPFDPIPKVTTVVLAANAGEASARWWSDVDRAQFRLDIDELQVAASSKLDWFANFRMTVIASGARQGNWEVFGRKIRCGGRHRMARKGFGLVETTVQPLLDGRFKVWVRAYESR